MNTVAQTLAPQGQACGPRFAGPKAHLTRLQSRRLGFQPRRLGDAIPQQFFQSERSVCAYALDTRSEESLQAKLKVWGYLPFENSSQNSKISLSLEPTRNRAHVLGMGPGVENQYITTVNYSSDCHFLVVVPCLVCVLTYFERKDAVNVHWNGKDMLTS